MKTKKNSISLILAMFMFLMIGLFASNQIVYAQEQKGALPNMEIRRIWIDTEDPIFLIDNYKRVWLEEHSNALAYGDYKTATKEGSLMAPMKQISKAVGIVYTEGNNQIVLSLNGQKITFEIGSKTVLVNDIKVDDLKDNQIPTKVDIKEKFGEFNTFLKTAYHVTYLPVAYVLDTFGAQLGVDRTSFYAALPVIKTSHIPSYQTATINDKTGYRNLLVGDLALDESVALNIVQLQNQDGGFSKLNDDVDMKQAALVDHLGTLKSSSTLLDGTTTAELKYLAAYIVAQKPKDSKYRDAFIKGVKYLLDNQHEQGIWQVSPTNAFGFNANLVLGNKVSVDVLNLLTDIAILNHPNYIFARKVVDIDLIKRVIDKANAFIVETQSQNQGQKAGWAQQFQTDKTPTMGKTYERVSVSSYTTNEVVAYLMRIQNPSDAVIQAIHAGITWLKDVKIVDKEQKIVEDLSMNNGFDVYLVDGHGTWASHYVFEEESAKYRPLYADVDPKRFDQMHVNTYDLKDVDRKGTTVSSNDLILYATRTTISYYDNTLSDDLISTSYPTWKGYLEHGFPAIAKDPKTNDFTWLITIISGIALLGLGIGSYVIYQKKHRKITQK